MSTQRARRGFGAAGVPKPGAAHTRTSCGQRLSGDGARVGAREGEVDALGIPSAALKN